MTNKPLSCIDVFSGIGGISLALSPYADTMLYCEMNTFCQQVLAERMKNGELHKAPIHGDIRTLYVSPLMQPTMLCGGFPCTDISSIGLKKGINTGTRSGLFLEMMRIVDENESIKVVFLENVANITKCGMQEVVEELSKRDFKFVWKMRSASSLGAPHQRMRWFCLAVKDNYDIGSVIDNTVTFDNVLTVHHWDNEPIKRVSFKPAFKHDEDYDTNWTSRCQTLGNTVVPIVVRSAFVELVKLFKNAPGIIECFSEFAKPVGDLEYPFPETGLIANNMYYTLPNFTSSYKSSNNSGQKILATIEFNGKQITFENYPTPRHGITHASTLTDRSLRDLPTILVYCKETKKFLTKTDNLPEDKSLKFHSIMTPNIQYIEWMMGYPHNWTKVSKQKQEQEPPLETNDADVQSEDSMSEEKVSIPKKHRRNTKPPSSPSSRVVRYNGMHMFMKEHQGKSIRAVAELWKCLSEEEKSKYSTKAKEYTTNNSTPISTQ